MKNLFLLAVLAFFISGCVGDNCFRYTGLGYDSEECKKYRETHDSPTSPGVEWFEYIALPIFIFLDAGSKIANTNKAVTSSQHYKAGGSAARDYVEKP